MSSIAASIEIIPGDAFSVEFQLLEQESPPDFFDLTQVLISSQARKSYESTSVLADFTVTILNAKKGKFKLSLTENETSNLIVGMNGFYDIRLQFSDGTCLYLPDEPAPFAVKPRITRTRS